MIAFKSLISVVLFSKISVDCAKMSVYEFEKSLLVRLEESTNVLQCRDEAVPASEVRSEWAYHVELQIEPAGRLFNIFYLNFCGNPTENGINFENNDNCAFHDGTKCFCIG